MAAPAGASIIIGSLASPIDGPNPNAVSCTDTAGHVYTIDSISVSSDFAPAAICSTHRIAAPLPAGSTLTITFTGPGLLSYAMRARALAVTGLASSPLDKTASNADVSTMPRVARRGPPHNRRRSSSG